MANERHRIITVVAITLLLFLTMILLKPEQKSSVLMWPKQLLGCKLYCLEEDFILYANNKEATEELREWLYCELYIFNTQYSLNIIKPFLIFAIEPGEEVFPAINKWADEYVDRYPVKWPQSKKHQWLVSYEYRPYCFSWKLEKPYFQESFSIPIPDAIKLGIINDNTPIPACICFITTDQHFKEKLKIVNDLANKKMTEVAIAANEEKELLKTEDRLIFGSLLLATNIFILPKWKRNDLALMHLQRFETLWDSMINSYIEDPNIKREELLKLHNKVENDWKNIYISAPVWP